MSNKLSIQLEDQCGNLDKYLPSIQLLESWTQIAVVKKYNSIHINILCVNEIKSASFNISFRNKAGATNVLSFSHSHDPDLVGDIIICSPLVISEAKAIHVEEIHHWMHLYIHGLLHLQGYDHEDDQEAIIMFNKEDEIIQEIKNRKISI